jgi:hypothetical protein
MLRKLIFIAILFGCVNAIDAQDTVTITIEDLRAFRKADADAKFWEKTAKDKDDQVAEANKSAAGWKNLYLSEKARADGVQEKRVGEATAAATDFQSANNFLREQNTDLKRDKRDLEDDVTSLESSRKYVFLGGVAVGGVTGFFGGRATCGASIPGLARSTAQPDFYRSPLYRQPEMPSPLRPAKEFLKTQF